MNKKISTHFTNKELDCSCGCGTTVKDEFLVYLELLRIKVNEPLYPTSGGRCFSHNKKVGGVVNSQHPKGLAVDLSCDNSKLRFKIISTAIKLGFTGIGIAETFIHLDRRKENFAIWSYK